MTVQITIDLIGEVVTDTELKFEDGQSSTEWLAPYKLQLVVRDARGHSGCPEVSIYGEFDALTEFVKTDRHMRDTADEFEAFVA